MKGLVHQILHESVMKLVDGQRKHNLTSLSFFLGGGGDTTWDESV